MIDFNSWSKRHDDWSAKSTGLEEKKNPNPKEVSLRSPDYQKTHAISSVSGIDSGSYAISGTYPGIVASGTSLACGAVPTNGGRTNNSVWRCWFSFGSAESGADASNYTTIDFIIGADFTSTNIIASGSTILNPAAGQTTFVLVSFGGRSIYRPSPNQTLFVKATKTGEASVDFSAVPFTFGFDFLQERIA